MRANIDARSGSQLGALFAAIAPEIPPAAREIEALSNGARLATLAIETRRLYADLRRRSEFDLLTDIYNRFSLHKRLDIMIQEANQSSGIFGLIYIDLDKFKPINDTYGHHIGDLFLQEVAVRMNRQLLGGDMLARLGGDEFAALVSLQHGHFDLEKIVARLESCFDDPFVIDGHVLMGSASIGTAVYPEDGATKDSLLNAADAAMYAVKNGKRQAEHSAAPDSPNCPLTQSPLNTEGPAFAGPSVLSHRPVGVIQGRYREPHPPRTNSPAQLPRLFSGADEPKAAAPRQVVIRLPSPRPRPPGASAPVRARRLRSRP